MPENSLIFTSTLHRERQDVIGSIIKKDQRVFETWISNPLVIRSLRMPPDALRYMLIPPRLFELAADPSHMDVIVASQFADTVHAMVVERGKLPHIPAVSESARRRLLNQDDFFKRNPGLIAQGKLNEADYPNIEIAVDSYPHRNLYVSHYRDRPELQGKGIGTDFYYRLRDVAKRMGFRFITGQNSTHNLSFFVDHLGRIPLNSIDPRHWNIFHPTPKNVDTKLYTIDFLYPDDRTLYVGPARTVKVA